MKGFVVNNYKYVTDCYYYCLLTIAVGQVNETPKTNLEIERLCKEMFVFVGKRQFYMNQNNIYYQVLVGAGKPGVNFFVQ
jgi:hypothetical protein